MNHAQRRSVAYVSISATLVACYIPLSHVNWRGSTELHTLLETTATLLAFGVGTIALVRYYTQKNTMYLLLGSGFVGAAVLDGYHAAVTSTFLAGYTPSALTALAPWSGLSSRILLSA